MRMVSPSITRTSPGAIGSVSAEPHWITSGAPESQGQMTYTISIVPAGKGQVIATSSDSHSFLTTTPLCDGSRYWLSKGTDPATYLCTVWSSGSTEWAMRAPIGVAAKLTVMGDRFHAYNSRAGPISLSYRPSPQARGPN
jgi:hypothetical protein